MKNWTFPCFTPSFGHCRTHYFNLISKKFNYFSIFPVLIFFLTAWTQNSAETQAQVMMEFTWTFGETHYEGLFFVPEDKPATMTVRVLDADGKMSALILERTDLLKDEKGAFHLKCFAPKILYGNKDYTHSSEHFTAADAVPGRVSNGTSESPYEINTISPENIEEIVGKYILKNEN